MKQFIIPALLSMSNFVKLVFMNKLHLERKNIGRSYVIPKRSVFTIFRETVNDIKIQDKKVILFVGFRLKFIGLHPLYHWLFQRLSVLTTPFWSGFRGFHIKLWMVDQAQKNYLGIYEWYGKENAQNYLTVLIPILYFFSVRKSVWYDIYQGKKLSILQSSLRDRSNVSRR